MFNEETGLARVVAVEEDSRAASEQSTFNSGEHNDPSRVPMPWSEAWSDSSEGTFIDFTRRLARLLKRAPAATPDLR
jgi:hypothetical protein